MAPPPRRCRCRPDWPTAILFRVGVAMTGPRQSGKTTLARQLFADKPYVRLEDPQERAFANE